SPYLTLAPGTYQVQVRVAGTRTVVFRGRVTTEANRAYSAAALGSVGGKGAAFRISILADA
ncbi:MAG: DUF4397 domain-containing protein, partial [Gaiellaceae bacterium]|nr:DUF4397 domain-containing protein [Gaiellaceae bacterium]